MGHAHHQAIAEFAIPEIVNSTELGDLKMVRAPVQPFARVLEKPSGGNPEKNNRIGGLLCLQAADGLRLLVNAYEYYDGPANNQTSMLVIRDAEHLADSPVDGYFALSGGPGHTAGWMSPIPPEWQTALGGKYLTGHSSGIPIIGRTSVGPSAFVFDPQEVLAATSAGTPIHTIRLLDYDLKHPLHKDLSNSTRQNDLWTHLSRVTYGIIIPGTRTYATFGYSGGHESGIGYKIIRDDGKQTGGYSSYKVKDNYHYYWLFDVEDLVRVRQGRMQPYQVRPYEYGVFRSPFSSSSIQIGGGSFDPKTGRIFLTALKADRQQGQYENPPIVMVLKKRSR